MEDKTIAKSQAQEEAARKFDNTMHLYGRVFGGIAVVLMLLVPVAVAIYFKAWPDWNGLVGGLVGICIVYLPVGIVEAITYAPILGTGASYLAFITGNLSNLKIPCAMNAREIVGTEFGTKENEIVSTLSVAVSALVTTVVLAAGVFLLLPLRPILESPTLAPAFNVVLPALFGALGYTYFSKNIKVAVAPFVIIVALCLIVPSMGGQAAVLIPLAAVIAMVAARILYKKGLIK